MSSKTATMKIKEGNQLVDFYPKTTMENVNGLQEALENIQGADYATVYQAAQSALDKANELDTVLKIPMYPVVRTDNNVFEYDGTMKAPTFAYLDTQRVVVSGTTQAINAGNYTAIFTPRYSSFTWSDTNDSQPKSIPWSIARKASTTTIDTSNISIGASALTKVITVTTDGDGELTAVSSNTSAATVSVSGNEITVTAGSDGDFVITVTLADGTNYTGGSWTINGSTAFISALSQATPQQVQYVAQNDLAASYWSIGDWFPMTLNGNWTCTDNTITLSNYVVRCVLIGINHNASKEGNHMLHFQMGKNSNGVDIAFYYSKMNTSNTNSGGWKSCQMRTTTMANLYNSIIPAAWRNVIKACTKYTDNTGGGSDNASYVTATSDNCWLLAEYEVFGSRSYANSAEQNYQQQYAYYANGNSKIRYRHDSPTSVHFWWLRGVLYNYSYYFCIVYINGGGNAYYTEVYNSSCISPCFCIG